MTTIDPKRTGVRAHLLNQFKFDAEPGDMLRTYSDDAKRIIGFNLACPGCAQWGGILFIAQGYFKNPWRVTHGTVDDISTLTVRESIFNYCCGWHGYLNNGVFELEAR